MFMKTLLATTLALLITLVLPISALALKPSTLTCEHLDAPQGIDIQTPRLSWVLQSEGRRPPRGEKQTAYQVLVASSAENLRKEAGDLWDSGKVESAQSVLVSYAGIPLVSGQACFWKVRIWDQQGKASEWSTNSSWSMGILGKETDRDLQGWTAQWIGKDEPQGDLAFTNGTWIWFPGGTPQKSAPLGKAWFRRQFELPRDRVVTSARLFVTADNTWTAYLNGQNLGSGRSFKAVAIYDVAAALKGENNTLAIEVENTGEGPNPAGLICYLRVEFDQGPPLEITTDSDWLCTVEYFQGWEASSFDASTWLKALEIGPAGMEPWGRIDFPEDRRLVARYIRKEFDAPKKIKRATAYYSGLGLSEVTFNGRRVDSDVLSPGLTEYDKRVFYVTRDVTGLIRRGPNAIGVILGNGRFYAPRSRVPTNTRSFGYPKLLMEVRLEFSDGSTQIVATDETWSLSVDGPVRFNNEYDGEEYDARKEMTGWDTAGFKNSSFVPARLVAAPGGKLRAQMIEPIREVQSLKPLSVKEPVPGTFIFDMGQNMVGWCELRVTGPAGTVVQLRHAETLKEDGTLYLDNIRGAKVTDAYTLKGRGKEVWQPRFTYHGFRYVEITGFPGRPSLQSIEGKVVHDDIQSAGEFACSDPLVNRIYSNVLWGVSGNYRSIPTDCPQRDERQGWLGDRTEECRGETYLFNVAALYAKWLRDIADGQRPNGSISDVNPTYWPMYNDNVTWPSSAAVIPGTLFQQYGDTNVLREAYPAAKKWILHMQSYITDGLIRKDNYGDWCVPPEDPKLIHSKDPARQTDRTLLASAYLFYDARLLGDYARTLGYPEDAASFENLSDQLKTNLNSRMFDPEKGFYSNGSQTACVLPLAFDLAPRDQRDRVFARLVSKIANESHDHIGTGLIGAQWLMRTLTSNGRDDLAWTIASQKTYPSWGYMVEKGATTIWELWNGDTADPAMNSGNHVMLVGDLITWLHEDIAGIKPSPEQPGFARIIMAPHMPKGVDWARASHHSPYGKIVSDWRKNGERTTWKVTIPPNSEAILSIPARSPEGITESGSPVAQAKGLQLLEPRGDRQQIKAVSGNYEFRW